MASQLVVIKTWDRMLKEYGVNAYGNIQIPFSFTEEMESLMPTHRIIELHDEDTWIASHRQGTGHLYTISQEMIASYLPKGIKHGEN